MKPTSSSNKFTTYDRLSWLVGLALIAIMVVAWWIERGLSFDTLNQLNMYNVFPLFGLIAFGLMWSHYTLGSLKHLLKAQGAGSSLYWSISSGLVLALIILHPLLLNIGLSNDGLGLPPNSYTQAYGQLAPYLMLGTICLLIFLSFELHRWHRQKSWWRYIEILQMVAMTGIFIHAIMLGRELSQPWFLAIWWILGLTLVGSWIYNYYQDKQTKVG